MHPGKCKPGELQMVKLRAQPGIDRVALLTLDGKARGHVIGFGGLLIGALVARITLNGKPLELPDRLTLVAVRTIQSGVSSHQWKAVIVFLDSLQNDVPPFHGMALFAVGSHLPAMNVSVAIRAIGSGVREDWLGMTLRARHSLVQATEGISCLVVVELRHCTDGLPARRCVAVLTGNIEVPVRAARNRRLPESHTRSEADHSQGKQGPHE